MTQEYKGEYCGFKVYTDDTLPKNAMYIADHSFDPELLVTKPGALIPVKEAMSLRPLAPEQIIALELENRRLRELLKECEWENYDGCCPICYHEGHKPDCRLAAALASPPPDPSPWMRVVEAAVEWCQGGPSETDGPLDLALHKAVEALPGKGE